MNFYQLAIRYLIKKKSKTILLLLVFVLIGSMVLSTSMILRATEDVEVLMQKKTNAKIIAEVNNEEDKISEEEVKKISALEGVASLNRHSYKFVFPDDFSPVTNSDSQEEDNLKMAVFSYDDLKNDSAFSEQMYRIIDGDYISPETENGVVINSLLAGLNGLGVGDTIQLKTADGNQASASIKGLFFSGSERKQADSTLAVNRVENIIFVDNGLYAKLFPKDGYSKVAVYAKNPKELKKLEEGMASIFSDKVTMTAADSLFRQMKAPLEQVTRVVRLMLALTFVTGTAVITILLCMWMRNRKKEAAIFVSMGKSKVSILLQVLLESFAVFIVSVLGACGAGSFVAGILRKFLMAARTNNISLDVTLNLPDVVSLLVIGSLIVLIAVTFSIFPILRANPRDTLSRMEG